MVPQNPRLTTLRQPTEAKKTITATNTKHAELPALKDGFDARFHVGVALNLDQISG
jgi:hypothetical protein